MELKLAETINDSKRQGCGGCFQMHTKITGLLIQIVLIVAPFAVNADEVTYDFTGTVIGTSGSYSGISAGEAVTGTYTINLGNGANTEGSIGSTNATWEVQNITGSEYGTSPSNSFVFADTVRAGSFSYSSPTVPGAYSDDTEIDFDDININNKQYVGSEEQVPANPNQSAAPYTASSFYLKNGFPGTFTSNGLPIPFSSVNSASDGQVVLIQGEAVVGELDYQINSLTLPSVPAPSSLWLLLSGVAGLGALRFRTTKTLLTANG